MHFMLNLPKDSLGYQAWNVSGITTVFGNMYVANATKTALGIVQEVQSSLPQYIGAVPVVEGAADFFPGRERCSSDLYRH
jgi:inosine-uridine nucleoside N-ribohydrolase